MVGCWKASAKQMQAISATDDIFMVLTKVCVDEKTHHLFLMGRIIREATLRWDVDSVDSVDSVATVRTRKKERKNNIRIDESV